MTSDVGPAPWFFDAHCDTFLRVVEKGLDFQDSSELQVTLSSMVQAGVRAQVFAAWTLAERLQGSEDAAAMRMLQAVGDTCRAYPEQMVLVETAEDLVEATKGPGRVAAICGLESADPLKGDPEALHRFHHAGMRVLTLAWGDNAFCGSCYGSDEGLTEQGRRLITVCEEQGVMVDVSHASDAAFWGVCGVSTKPFIASHSNSRALGDEPRNLSDQMIRALAERGGVAGLNLYSGFLSGEFAARVGEYLKESESDPMAKGMSWDEKGSRFTGFLVSLPRPPLSLVAEHAKHLIAVGGEDCVGLGGDLDGCDAVPQGLDSVADYPRIVQELRAVGLSSSQVDKVCHGNFLRVFQEVLP